MTPVSVAPSATGAITVRVKPKGAPGGHVSGTLYIDDYSLNVDLGMGVGEGDIAAIPYSYVVAAPADLGIATPPLHTPGWANGSSRGSR